MIIIKSSVLKEKQTAAFCMKIWQRQTFSSQCLISLPLHSFPVWHVSFSSAFSVQNNCCQQCHYLWLPLRAIICNIKSKDRDDYMLPSIQKRSKKALKQPLMATKTMHTKLFSRSLALITPSLTTEPSHGLLVCLRAPHYCKLHLRDGRKHRSQEEFCLLTPPSNAAF